MTDRPRLLVDPESQRAKLTELVDRLVAVFDRDPLRDAIGDAGVRKVRKDRDAAIDRLSQPFTLVVLGDFKRGKSTLVNALVGADIAPTDVTPETVTVNTFTWGAQERVRAVLADGTRAVLEPEDLRRERLVDVLARLPSRPTHLVVERPEPWLHELRLVDTPGLGDLDPELSRAVLDWLPRADAVLFVITAVSPLSDSERLFLRLTVLPAQLAKVTFVLNRVDGMSDLDVDRLTTSIGAKLRVSFPHAPLFPVSAVHPDDARFAALRRHLDEALLVDREVVKLDRAALQARRAVDAAQDRLRRLDAALAADQDRLGEQLSQIGDRGSALHAVVAAKREQLMGDVRALGNEAAKWMGEFIDRLVAERVVDLGRHSHEVLRRHFPFFLAERTQQALTACIDAHRPQIDGLLLAACPRASGGVEFGADDTASVAGFATPASVWTLADDVGMLGSAAELVAPFVGPMIAAALVPLGLLESFAGLAVRGVLQKTAGEKAKGQAFHEHVLHAMPELKRSLDLQVQALYTELANRVVARFDELWATELATAAEVLAQAQGVRSRGEVETEAVRRGIARAEAGLVELAADVDAYRASLEHLL